VLLGHEASDLSCFASNDTTGAFLLSCLRARDLAETATILDEPPRPPTEEPDEQGAV
jgi:hypothetical protein